MELTPTMTTFFRQARFARRFFAALAMALALCGSLRAEEGHAAGGAQSTDTWWDKAWTVRKKVTIDATQAGGNITEPIGGATVLIRLYDANYPNPVKEDLADLRFVSEDDKTVFPHHVEKIDSVMAEAYVWVKVPEIKPNAKTSFWMYFGSGDPKAVKAEDPKASYDADTVLVFHFGESGAPAADSTKNGNVTEGPGGKSEGSCIGNGMAFNGKQLVNIAPSPTLLWTDGAPMTLSAWVKLAGPQPNAIVLSRREGAKSLVIGADAGKPFIEVSGQRAVAQTALAPAAWAHFAVVCEGAKTTLYVNGEMAGAVPAGLPGMNSAIVLGGDSAGGTGLTGELDELQIHKVARSIGYVQMASWAQNGDKVSKLVLTGTNESPSSWFSWLTTGHFGIIIMNLTMDGWIVIVLLAIMFVISWYVMVNKVRYLNGISKGNVLFMDQWQHVAADLTVLDDGDPENIKTLGGRVTPEQAKKLRMSSVYRIYRIGAEEIRHRLIADRAEGVRRGLAGRSIQAVRASLDGGMVRETQKLNSSVVLLTICISGGPFLGLLGTVIGVMITFAAVAAAGDVNVNAIAPGIAAALLATVAGLAVAIPALFGYNYILGRVKDAKDDMHVFVDEFVARMAEFYKEPKA